MNHKEKLQYLREHYAYAEQVVFNLTEKANEQGGILDKADAARLKANEAERERLRKEIAVSEADNPSLLTRLFRK